MNEFQLFKDFCNDYLVELTDDKFSLIYNNPYTSSFTIKIIFNGYELYKYSDIKDQFIPFIIMLNDTYKILDISMMYTSGIIHTPRNIKLSYNRIISDNVDNNKVIDIYGLLRNEIDGIYQIEIKVYNPLNLNWYY